MSFPERPSKQQAFLALLKRGWVSLHLDARHPGVVVPVSFRGEPHLVLQYGYDLPILIPDLEVGDQHVRATLSFSRTAHLTVVPWSAVYVISCIDGSEVRYTEDVPEDILIAEPPAVRRLQSVPAHPEAELAEPLAEALTVRRRRRPQLRLVK
jgi:stringent starvation protein B